MTETQQILSLAESAIDAIHTAVGSGTTWKYQTHDFNKIKRATAKCLDRGALIEITQVGNRCILNVEWTDGA